MEYKETTWIPNDVCRSGKFISSQAYRLYTIIASFKEEWVPLNVIGADYGFGSRSLIRALHKLKSLGLIESSEKTICNSDDLKVRLTDRSQWKFSKAHLAHLKECQ